MNRINYDDTTIVVSNSTTSTTSVTKLGEVTINMNIIYPAMCIIKDTNGTNKSLFIGGLETTTNTLF